MTIHYLSIDDVARHLGLSVFTVRAYYKQGRLPAPDAVIGLDPNNTQKTGWIIETIDTWNASRPGRGRRTDLLKD